MPLLASLFGFVFNTALGRLLAAAAGLLVLAVSFAAQQRSIGAVKERATIQEKARDNVRKADDARARVRDPAARGVRDPYARD